MISKYAYLAFRERKEALTQERYEHLKAERMQEYEQCLNRSSREYDILLVAVTKAAAEHIGLNEEGFQLSMQAVLADPAFMNQLDQNDENIRLEVEEINQISKERAIQILKEKIQMEQEANDKLAKIKEQGSPQERMNLPSTKMLEQTKILDRIFIKYELKYVDLQAAEKENNLRNEPEIIAFRNSIKAKHSLMKVQAVVEAAKAKFTAEQQAEIDQVIAEKGPVRNTAGANGKLDEEEFWKAFEIIVTLQVRYQHRAMHDNAQERRALLLSN